MDEAGHSDISEVSQAIDSLREIGADTFDPVRFFYLQVLARRALSQQGPVKRHLDHRMAQALVTLRERFEQAKAETRQAVDHAAVKPSSSRLEHTVHGSPLAELTRHLSHHRSQDATDNMGGTGENRLRPELKATQYFRNTWAKLSVNKRVTQALNKAPKNAGPINSHMLVLRSLALMRDISPDYLNRLTAYVDTLLSLDQWDRQNQATAKKATDTASGKRIRSRSASRKA